VVTKRVDVEFVFREAANWRLEKDGKGRDVARLVGGR
jgi:hypothetical protein